VYDKLYKSVYMDELHNAIDPLLELDSIDNSVLEDLFVEKSVNTVGRMFV